MSILKKTVVFAGIVAAAIMMSGCATPISISEVMQEPQGTRYFLKHNVWTEGSKAISSINYQRGSIVPFGTQVEILELTKNTVRFKVVSSGAEFTIRYHEKYGMKPIEDYVKQLISTQSIDQLTKGVNRDFIASMKRGEVLPGMTRKEVLLTYGPPSPHRTPSQDGATWIYWLRRWPISKTSRVIFKGDKVLQVMK